MLSDEDRTYILNEFLRVIDNVSDKNYQIRIWIKGEGPEVDDFDETVCFFFDTGDPILKSYKEYSITEEQYELLKKFRDAFEIFAAKNHWPEFFIDTPEWKKIMERAEEVLKAFNYERDHPCC